MVATEKINGIAVITKKIMATTIALIFAATTAAQAAPNVYQITVPDENGTVSQRYKGTGDKVIIHIQDAHANLDAQVNLARIVCNLLPQLGKDNPFIGIEGAIGGYDLKVLRDFPIKDIKEKVGRQFVKDGTFVGSELANIIADNDFTLFGCEEKTTFRANYEAFINVMRERDNLAAELDRTVQGLSQLKSAIYNTELTAFDTQATAYEQGSTQLLDYLGVLYGQLETRGFDILEYLQLAQFREVFQLQRELSEDALRSELEVLIRVLDDGTVPVEGRPSITQAYQDYRANTLSQQQIVMVATSTAIAAGRSLDAYPMLVKARKYWTKYALIDFGHFMREIRQADTALRMSLATTKEEKLLVDMWDKVMTLKQLLSLAAVQDDVEEFKNDTMKYSMQFQYKGMDVLAARAGISLVAGTPVINVDQIISVVDRFYSLAEDRNTIMLDNLLNQMDAQGQTVGVLVSGGFHSDGLTQLMRDRGISYLTITPRIDSLETDVAYMNRMMGGNLPTATVPAVSLAGSRFNATGLGLQQIAEVQTAASSIADANIDVVAVKDTLQTMISATLQTLDRDPGSLGSLESLYANIEKYLKTTLKKDIVLSNDAVFEAEVKRMLTQLNAGAEITSFTNTLTSILLDNIGFGVESAAVTQEGEVGKNNKEINDLERDTSAHIHGHIIHTGEAQPSAQQDSGLGSNMPVQPAGTSFAATLPAVAEIAFAPITPVASAANPTTFSGTGATRNFAVSDTTFELPSDIQGAEKKEPMHGHASTHDSHQPTDAGSTVSSTVTSLQSGQITAPIVITVNNTIYTVNLNVDNNGVVAIAEGQTGLQALASALGVSQTMSQQALGQMLVSMQNLFGLNASISLNAASVAGVTAAVTVAGTTASFLFTATAAAASAGVYAINAQGVVASTNILSMVSTLNTIFDATAITVVPSAQDSFALAIATNAGQISCAHSLADTGASLLSIASVNGALSSAAFAGDVQSLAQTLDIDIASLATAVTSLTFQNDILTVQGLTALGQQVNMLASLTQGLAAQIALSNGSTLTVSQAVLQSVAAATVLQSVAATDIHSLISTFQNAALLQQSAFSNATFAVTAASVVNNALDIVVTINGIAATATIDMTTNAFSQLTVGVGANACNMLELYTDLVHITAGSTATQVPVTLLSAISTIGDVVEVTITINADQAGYNGIINNDLMQNVVNAVKNTLGDTVADAYSLVKLTGSNPYDLVIELQNSADGTRMILTVINGVVIIGDEKILGGLLNEDGSVAYGSPLWALTKMERKMMIRSGVGFYGDDVTVIEIAAASSEQTTVDENAAPSLEQTPADENATSSSVALTATSEETAPRRAPVTLKDGRFIIDQALFEQYVSDCEEGKQQGLRSEGSFDAFIQSARENPLEAHILLATMQSSPAAKDWFVSRLSALSSQDSFFESMMSGSTNVLGNAFSLAYETIVAGLAYELGRVYSDASPTAGAPVTDATGVDGSVVDSWADLDGTALQQSVQALIELWNNDPAAVARYLGFAKDAVIFEFLKEFLARILPCQYGDVDRVIDGYAAILAQAITQLQTGGTIAVPATIAQDEWAMGVIQGFVDQAAPKGEITIASIDQIAQGTENIYYVGTTPEQTEKDRAALKVKGCAIERGVQLGAMDSFEYKVGIMYFNVVLSSLLAPQDPALQEKGLILSLAQIFTAINEVSQAMKDRFSAVATMQKTVAVAA